VFYQQSQIIKRTVSRVPYKRVDDISFFSGKGAAPPHTPTADAGGDTLPETSPRIVRIV